MDPFLKIRNWHFLSFQKLWKKIPYVDIVKIYNRGNFNPKLVLFSSIKIENFETVYTSASRCTHWSFLCSRQYNNIWVKNFTILDLNNMYIRDCFTIFGKTLKMLISIFLKLILGFRWNWALFTSLNPIS